MKLAVLWLSGRERARVALVDEAGAKALETWLAGEEPAELEEPAERGARGDDDDDEEGPRVLVLLEEPAELWAIPVAVAGPVAGTQGVTIEYHVSMLPVTSTTVVTDEIAEGRLEPLEPVDGRPPSKILATYEQARAHEHADRKESKRRILS